MLGRAFGLGPAQDHPPKRTMMRVTDHADLRFWCWCACSRHQQHQRGPLEDPDGKTTGGWGIALPGIRQLIPAIAVAERPRPDGQGESIDSVCLQSAGHNQLWGSVGLGFQICEWLILQEPRQAPTTTVSTIKKAGHCKYLSWLILWDIPSGAQVDGDADRRPTRTQCNNWRRQDTAA